MAKVCKVAGNVQKLRACSTTDRNAAILLHILDAVDVAEQVSPQ